jgi:hypothetical protein
MNHEQVCGIPPNVAQHELSIRSRFGLEPNEAYQRCPQSLDPLRLDYAAAQVCAALALQVSWESWPAKSG